MPNQIFSDENRNYQIDFSSANWASDDANRALRKFQLKDVDWIVETGDEWNLQYPHFPLVPFIDT